MRLAALLIALAVITPAHAAVRHRIAVPIPLSDPRLPVNAMLDAGKTAAAPAPTSPLAMLQKITTADLNNAIALANAQTPPDTVALACWTALLPIVQAASTAPGGTSAGNALQFGAATGIQDTRDAQALIANLQSPTGPLAQINTACAPVVVQLQTTITLLVGGGAIAIAGGPAVGGGVLAALQALLIAMPKIP